ncbi:MAG: ADP-forming succinate--CoA ligase subunit beta [bacterium]
MKIHEYQAKQQFEQNGVPVPDEIKVESAEQAREAAEELGGRVVVKAQVHTGGRGKAGGVKLVESPEEAREAAGEILGMDIKGHTVHKVLVAEQVDYEDELYLGIVFDRGRETNAIMGCSEGGVDIETLAEEHPDAIHKEWAHPTLGLRPFQLSRLAYSIAPRPELGRPIAKIAGQLVETYESTDANVTEINPLVTHSDNTVTALDAKMNFDDNALYRHPDIAELRDPEEEDPLEQKAREAELHYVRLDGEVGIIGNGAGLVMTTLDVVAQAGGTPANFLDIGGSSSPEKVKTALEILVSNENTRSILINVFGGITRCDDVAKGLIQGVREAGIDLPIVVRLTGTNEKEGKRIIEESDIEIESVNNMEDAADLAVSKAGKTAAV